MISTGTLRFASIFFPEFPIQMYCRSSGIDQTASIALFKHVPKGTEVVYCSKRAQKSGIRVGMPLHIATAIDSSLITRSISAIDPLHELSKIAESLLSFSPTVGIDPLVTQSSFQDKRLSELHFGINLNFSGTARLYPCNLNLLLLLQKHILDLHLVAKIALTSTLGRAWAHARFSSTLLCCDDNPSSVNSYHVSALRIPKDLAIQLEDFGIVTIESLLKLPTKSITKRFGPLLVERLRSLNQSTAEVIETVTPSPIRTASFLFDPPTQDMNAVRHAILDRCNYLLSSVRKEHKSIRGMLFEIKTVTDSFLKAITIYNHQSAEQLCNILDPFLISNSYRDGVTHICIKLTEIEDTSYLQDDFFNPQKTRSYDLESKFLSLISNKIDNTQINISHFQNSHLPELEVSFTSIHSKPKVTWERVPESELCNIRPGIFYPKSKPIAVSLTEETMQPNVVRYRKITLTIIRSVGPENIEYPWYFGGIPHYRSYYSVQDTFGRWYWIYKNSKDNSWHLSGIFA